ncbi:MAG: succinylglutamate desuccinylase/aspartoacylase family protein [Paracoccaceae bacterium]|nr:succinylglutamate desuccinylase/aspartoacylase family protein [Paracoccaceae bacterium]
MARRPGFPIGGRVVAPGKAATIDLPVSMMSDHTPVHMSVHVRHGKSEGPTLFVSAGVHGDEVIGIEIIRRLLRASKLRSMKGTLIAVPIVNSLGFLNRSRYLPDRRDLNRCFPGSEEGSLAARLAHLFLTEIVARADLGIDLHSAAIHRMNYPQIRLAEENGDLRRLGDAFGAPIIIQSPHRDGSLRKAAAAHDTPVLLYEAGEALRFDEVSVRVGLAGILRVMRELGMVSGRGIAPPKSPPQFATSSKWLRAPIGGLFRAFRSGGHPVRRGDLLGSVADPFGEVEESIVAPFSGIIVGRAVMPVVNEGDAVFHLARVASVARAEDALEDHSAQLAADPMFDEDEII